MHVAPYVRLRLEDLPPGAEIRAWRAAAPETVRALGLDAGRVLALPLAGRAAARGAADAALREGLVTLLALEPSHPDRTLYLELVERSWPRFGPWLERRVGRAFRSGRWREGVRDAVAIVNLAPARGEARFNLGLLLTRLVAAEPEAADARRLAGLARGEFARAAELGPDLFWGYYHRGVLAFEAALPEAARQDWVRFLDRYFADKPAPAVSLRDLAPFPLDEEGAELPALAYTVLLDVLALGVAREGAPLQALA